MADTGGWSLTEGFSDEGTQCLAADEGGAAIVQNYNPLTPSQMRALGEHLIFEANKMEK